MPFFVQPISAVFYPVDVLPDWLQRIALCLPSTHVFEGMREVLKTGGVSWDKLLWASGLNLIALSLSGAFFFHILRTARKQGLLTKIATH